MRKLAAILFSDIAGYSAMMSKDEKYAMKILEKNRIIHKSFISRYNGQYIKEIGDGTLAIFQSGYDAVQCAIMIRNACSSVEGLQIRIGIHVGDVILQENDVFGDSVNIASRIESAGEAGGIFISEKVYDDLKNKEGITAEFYSEKNLKNIPDPVKIFKITSQDCSPEFSSDEIKAGPVRGPRLSRQSKTVYYALLIIAIIIVIAIKLFKPEIFRQDQLKDVRTADGKIAIAVLPFNNMTGDTTWNVWQEGIQDLLITSLSNTKELKVRQFESVNSLLKSKGVISFASLTPELAGGISRKLEAGVFIFGNIKQAGQALRISAQLIDSKTQEVFKSFQINTNKDEDNIFPLLDSMSNLVKDFLIIRQMEEDLTPDYQRLATTSNPEAYRYFIMGKNSFMKMDFESAASLCLKALEIDSNFTLAGIFLVLSCGNQEKYDDARRYYGRISGNIKHESFLMQLMIKWCHAALFETPNEELIYCKQLIEIDNQNPMFYYQLGYIYSNLFLYENAVYSFEQALKIYDNWESKPFWVWQYTGLIRSYIKAGQPEKARDLCKKAESDFPGESRVRYQFAVSYLSLNDTIAAKLYLEEIKANLKQRNFPEYEINLYLGNIYQDAGKDAQAEQYYRRAYQLNPKDVSTLNTFGYFLADKEINIDEGVELLTQALAIAPDDYLLMDSKGWALYKQGKLKEATALIEKSHSLAPYYNHEIFTHLQEVRKLSAM